MKSYSAKQIRNVAVLGHSGSGKTTIMEAALFESGVTKRMGKVDEGNTVSDYEQEEIRRKVSINASLIPVEWNEHKINFIDTPGYFDFVGEVKQALAASDIALIAVSGKSGVEVGTEKAWEYATELNLPKMFFINNMDDENADMDKVLEELRSDFGKSIAPLQVPIKEGSKFVGYVNVIKMEAHRFEGGKAKQIDIPSGMEDELAIVRSMIIEAVAETDDELMEKFFSDEELSVDEINEGLKNGIAQGIVTPVLCGAALQSVGIFTLLNSIVKFVPPVDEAHSPFKYIDAKTDEVKEADISENAPPCAFVFKTIADPYVGRLNIFKVFSGIIKRDMSVYNAKKDIVEKIGHIYVLRGKEQIEVDELRAGDIGAVAKLAGSGTQDTFSTKENQMLIPPIEFPESVMSLAIIPKGKGDEDKISSALSKLLEEDMTLKNEINTETKQSIISGIGDQHLDVVVLKLKNKYKIEVELSTPIIPYREMIKSKVRIQGKYKKQSGGHGQYGDVHIEFEPSGDLSQQFIFEEKVFGGSVPRQYFPAVEKGLQDCINHGILADYPVVGLKATLVDGSYHPVDSSEMAFKMATSVAFKEGLAKAKPTILEPIARVEITVPNDYTGDVMGDMNKRRGRILGMNPYKGKTRLEAEAPIAEMVRYSTDLRSITQSRGEYTYKFDRYEEAPADVQQKVIAARQKEAEK